MDDRKIINNKIARLFDMSRDAVVLLRQDIVVYANPAAKLLLGAPFPGQSITSLLPDFPVEADEEYMCAVSIGGTMRTVQSQLLDDTRIITIPHVGSATTQGMDSVLQQLRQCVFSMRMTLDAAFPPEELNEKTSTYASVLYHNQHSLLRLTGTSSDAMALADGSFSCSLRPMDLGQLCNDLVNSVNHLTGGQTARVEFQCAPTAFPAMIDRNRMEQLLLQLICNALQHTPADGTVRLELSRQGKNLILRLDDNGEGIPPSRLANLFTDDTEAAPGDLAPRGIGLGLHIAQGIVRAHGGTMILQTKEGQGTRVQITLPAKDRLVLRDSSAADMGPSQLLTELAPILSHRAYRKEYRD
jgi:signal transduction histidine kinase